MVFFSPTFFSVGSFFMYKLTIVDNAGLVIFENNLTSISEVCSVLSKNDTTSKFIFITKSSGKA